VSAPLESGPGPIVLSNPRRIYILPTGFGLVYATLVGGMLIGSLNYNNNLGFLLGFLLVGLGLVAMLQTWRNLYGLALSPMRAEPVFAGQAARFPFRLVGPGRAAIEMAAQSGEGTALLDLDSQMEAQTAWLSVPAERRGPMSLGRIKISTRFPLGLFRAWAYAEPTGQVLVFPRPSPRRQGRFPAEYRHSELGDRGVGTDDFVGLRSYHAGDSPRQIDWKAMARGRGLLAKQFGGDRADRLWVDWDAWPAVPSEERLSRLCREILDAAAAQLEYGLRLPGLEIAPARGAPHQQLCLAALARFEVSACT